MKIIRRTDAVKLRWSMPNAKFERFDLGKYKGKAKDYLGREVPDIEGVLAVFAENRQDSYGSYVVLRSVSLGEKK